MSYHIETSQSICRANQLTGFHMMGTLVDKGLKKQIFCQCLRKLSEISETEKKQENKKRTYPQSSALFPQKWKDTV